MKRIGKRRMIQQDEALRSKKKYGISFNRLRTPFSIFRNSVTRVLFLKAGCCCCCTCCCRCLLICFPYQKIIVVKLLLPTAMGHLCSQACYLLRLRNTRRRTIQNSKVNNKFDLVSLLPVGKVDARIYIGSRNLWLTRHRRSLNRFRKPED